MSPWYELLQGHTSFATVLLIHPFFLEQRYANYGEPELQNGPRPEEQCTILMFFKAESLFEYHFWSNRGLVLHAHIHRNMYVQVDSRIRGFSYPLLAAARKRKWKIKEINGS